MARPLCVAVALSAFAGCTLSIPAPPDERADLPVCSADQIAEGGNDGFVCAPQAALTVSSAGQAQMANTADLAATAAGADEAGEAAVTAAVTSNAQMLIGSNAYGGFPTNPSQPGIWVGGRVRMVDASGSSPVSFVVASVDSPSGNPTTATGGAAPVPVFTTAVDLPPRPALAELSSNFYRLRIRASGALSGAGDLSAGTFTRCQVVLNVVDSTSAPVSSTAETVTAFGDDIGTRIPWSIAANVDIQAVGTTTFSLTLQPVGGNASSPGCSTGQDDGELTHLEIESD